MMRVARWHGALVAALFASALGLYVGAPALFVLATVPLGYVVYGLVADLGPPSLAVSRAVDPDHADPGDPVTVTLTVENTGERPIPDLRVVDGVPDDVAVADGTPAACVALRPGEAVTVEYDLLPPRGTHEFDDVVVRGRSIAGSVVGTTALAADGAETVTCDTLLDAFPLREATTRYAGPRATDTPGSGIEFHSVREYRRGDAPARIDWRRFARTGDLATVDYREERAAAVVFVVDGRAGVALCSPRGGPTATDLAVYAAAQGFVTLTGEGHDVGVATLAPTATRDYVPPGRGETTRAAAMDLVEGLRRDGAPDAPDPAADGDDPATVAADGAGPASEPDGEELGLRLAERLPASAQVVLCTPLVDDVPIDVAETLLARRHAVTVLSPDVTHPPDGGNPTPGQAVTDIGRRRRLSDLTALGVPAADWSLDEPLGVALARLREAHRGRWNR